MSTLPYKLTLAPTLVVAVSLAGRRWGARAAGLLAGLPVVGGPILLLVALDQGPAFGARAAIATTLGLVSLMAFCAAYSWSARWLAWWGSLLVGYATFFAFASALARVDVVTITPLGAGLASLAALGATLALMPRPTEGALTSPPTPRWWDLPLRACFTGGLVLSVTTAAHLLGPRWTGLVAPFPIATSVLAVFAHAQTGSPVRLLRGLLTGLVGFIAFTTVVAATLEGWGTARAFTTGLGAALAVGLLLFQLRRADRRE